MRERPSPSVVKKKKAGALGLPFLGVPSALSKEMRLVGKQIALHSWAASWNQSASVLAFTSMTTSDTQDGLSDDDDNSKSSFFTHLAVSE